MHPDCQPACVHLRLPVTVSGKHRVEVNMPQQLQLQHFIFDAHVVSVQVIATSALIKQSQPSVCRALWVCLGTQSPR